ncbi:DivIVA domain-containing protein [Paenarthrobacter sp. DKR-5]|uniref:DivIVA domain-containing protein n=1 Tax=Paenarthrobacter sp. DKR-5 TaxID=2835535 RepID=UPI001BDCCFED|nr:DivIVA domain-containing protein [Paenarthrobacter sp. DKR-5]MBT1002906.1 DivIVA domain-containing protein [Paenarthrobacter sp. DKR-5]
MSFFLVFLAVALAGLTAFVAAGIPRRAARNAAGDSTLDGMSEPVPSLPPVLLPEHAAPQDVDRLRFALGLRGYRMDQVDEVLDRLRDELAAKDTRIRRLEEELAGRTAPAGDAP